MPLYSLSAGNLGTSAQEVEAALGYALELCHMWNAMLLLDEADVFLNARTSAHDGLTRNELVSGMYSTHLDKSTYMNMEKKPKCHCSSVIQSPRTAVKSLLWCPFVVFYKTHTY